MSSLFSIILLFTFLLNYHIYNLFKIIGGCLIILISFKYSSKRRLLIMISTYYLLQFSFIGILSVFNVKGLYCLVFLFLICLLLIIYSKKSHISTKQTYKVIVKLRNKELYLDGFLDTGNIANYCNKPIIFLDKKYYDKELIVETVIGINTVNGLEYINCYKPAAFYILEKNIKIQKDVLVAFTNFKDDINCLLNNLLFI